MSEPHDPPTVSELVEAVREFLERDVLDATDGQVRFHARVAINVLAMVQRELEQGGGQAEAHAARLARLGFSGEEELAAAIRSGALDDRWSEVVETLRATVRDKLLVANPSYLDLP